MRSVYIIERALINPLYTWGEEPYLYVADGYVTSEALAQDYCRGCRVFTQYEHKFLPQDVPEFKYQKARPFRGHRVRHFETVEELEASYGG